MLSYDYTLRDKIYQYSVKKAAESNDFLNSKKRLMITGGAATQLILGADSSEYFRPTDDVDLFADSYLSQQQRKQWSKGLQGKIKSEGLEAKRRLTDDWAEISLEGLRNGLFIRLNCLNPYYYLGLKRKVEGEFERAVHENFCGTNVVYQHPMDVITNKASRILELNKIVGLPIGPEVLRFVQTLIRGGINDIETNDYKENVDSLVSHKRQDVEDLGRLTNDKITEQVQGYKVRKDVYDICCVIDTCRTKGIKINPNEFKKCLGLMLSYSLGSR